MDEIIKNEQLRFADIINIKEKVQGYKIREQLVTYYIDWVVKHLSEELALKLRFEKGQRECPFRWTRKYKDSVVVGN